MRQIIIGRSAITGEILFIGRSRVRNPDLFGDQEFRVVRYTGKKEIFAKDRQIGIVDVLNETFGFGIWRGVEQRAIVEYLVDQCEYPATVHYWERNDGFKTHPDVYVDDNY